MIDIRKSFHYTQKITTSFASTLKVALAILLSSVVLLGNAQATLIIGNPLVDASDSGGNPGDIIFDSTTGLATENGIISSWSFFDNDDLATNVLITPMILKMLTSSTYEITGIGATRTSTELGVQNYLFNLQSGSDEVFADGTYFFGWRNANADGSMHHVSGVDAAWGGSNTSYYSVSSNNATPVGSNISFYGFQAKYSYSATITSVPEPSTLVIFALGVMGLASRRFKQQS
jgi:hypothetical protein